MLGVLVRYAAGNELFELKQAEAAHERAEKERERAARLELERQLAELPAKRGA